jgi:hypothetical protein
VEASVPSPAWAASWRQVAELAGPGTIVNDNFGFPVAVSGSPVVVGALDDANDSGRAYVFTNTASGWHQAAELAGCDTVATDGFGGSVAVSGGTVVVGAAGHANYTGRAYLFQSS